MSHVTDNRSFQKSEYAARVHNSHQMINTNCIATENLQYKIMLNKISRTILINAGLHKVFLAV